MARETFQLSRSAAEIYEEQKVPAIFGPLAQATLDRVTLFPDDTILDVACGTGIVARLARGRVGPTARIVGADLNETMIAAAQSRQDDAARSCEWRVSDVTAMPFEDDAFSVVLCQQGLQFFPDERTALSEMKRVLRPAGRLALSVWSGPSALFTVMADVLARHVSDAAAAQSLAPFGYKGRGDLEARLAGLGFVDISKDEIAIDRVIKDPNTSIPKEIMGNPVGPAVAETGADTMARIVEDMVAGLADYRRGADLVVPQHSDLFQAKAGDF